MARMAGKAIAQRASRRNAGVLLLVRRKRSDDLVETWVAPKSIPVGRKLEFTIRDAYQHLSGGSEFLECEVLLPHPGVDERKGRD